MSNLNHYCLWSDSKLFILKRWSIVLMVLIELMATVWLTFAMNFKLDPCQIIVYLICLFVNDTFEVIVFLGSIKKNYCLTMTYVPSMSIYMLIVIWILIMYDVTFSLIIISYVFKFFKLIISYYFAQEMKTNRKQSNSSCEIWINC